MEANEQGIKSGSSRIAFLDGLRGYAIVMVVATHGMAYTALEDSTIRFLSFWVQAIAVPPFFLADGYLFVHALRKQSDFSYASYCLRSAKRLLIPWLSFNLLYLCFRAIFEFWGHPSVTVVRDHSFQDVLFAIYYSEISAQLYFLPALFFIRAVSFGTRFLVALPAIGLFIIWLIYVGIWDMGFITHRQESQLDPLVHAAWGLQFYLLGMGLGIHAGTIDVRPYVATIIGMLCLSMATAGYQAWGIVAQYAYLIGMYFLFLGFGQRRSLFGFLGGFTMGIYLFHAPVVLKFCSVIVMMLFYRGGVMAYLTIVGFAILASLVMTQLCRRFVWGQFMLGEAQRIRHIRTD